MTICTAVNAGKKDTSLRSIERESLSGEERSGSSGRYNTTTHRSRSRNQVRHYMHDVQLAPRFLRCLGLLDCRRQEYPIVKQEVAHLRTLISL